MKIAFSLRLCALLLLFAGCQSRQYYVFRSLQQQHPHQPQVSTPIGQTESATLSPPQQEDLLLTAHYGESGLPFLPSEEISQRKGEHFMPKIDRSQSEGIPNRNTHFSTDSPPIVAQDTLPRSEKKTTVFGAASTGLSLISLATIPLGISFFLALGGVVTGIIGLRKFRKEKQKGKGLALFGLLLGTGIMVIFILSVLIFVSIGL